VGRLLHDIQQQQYKALLGRCIL